MSDEYVMEVIHGIRYLQGCTFYKCSGDFYNQNKVWILTNK